VKETELRIIPVGPDETAEASGLVLQVFDEFVGREYGEQGNRIFREFASPAEMKKRLRAGSFILCAMMGDRKGDRMAGVIEIREHHHICLLFVRKEYHGRGIAGRLLEKALRIIRERAPEVTKLTVNSSPYAEKAYEKLGFSPTGPLCEKDGIRSVPMEMNLKPSGPDACSG